MNVLITYMVIICVMNILVYRISNKLKLQKVYSRLLYSIAGVLSFLNLFFIISII